MECRAHCGACCIAPAINQPYFGMPEGKPAGVVCIHLDKQTFQCAIWGTQEYPETCRHFRPEVTVCGHDRDEALKLIGELERVTSPNN